LLPSYVLLQVDRLVDQVDTSNSGRVRRSALAASQMDWHHLQQNNMQEWLEIARTAFAALDKDQDGFLRTEEIINSIRAKLPGDELMAVVRQAMEEAGDPGMYLVCQSMQFLAWHIMSLVDSSVS
jgi:Ca2+-binding EF-hand superfamily protein